MTVAHRLAPLFDFSSLAVVGASENSARGPRGLAALQALGWQGRYYPVNARAATVFGMKAYPNVTSLPEVPDMVMIVIPRRGVPAIIEECADVGVKAAVIVSNGFLEIDEEGAELQARITATARTRGPLVIGPNCLGLLSMVNRCGAFGGTVPPEAGNVAVISHSGGLMNEVLATGTSRGVRFSHLVSAGNEAGVTAADIIDYYIADPATEVVLGIVETARDPEGFRVACERARAARKPIVLLKMGRSQKGRYSAFTHTGAFAGNDDAYSAFFREQGITQVNDLDELVDMAVVLSAARPILESHRLERAGIIEISGGGKELSCDTAAAAGVPLPELSEAGQKAIREVLNEEYPTTNPLDSGGGWGDADKSEVYPVALDVFASEENIDVVVSRYTIPRAGGLGPLAERITEMNAARAAHPDRLFVVLSRTTEMWSQAWEDAIRDHHIPFLQGYGRGPRALAHLAAYSRFLHGPDPRDETQPPTLPAPPTRTLDDGEARSILEAAGLSFASGTPTVGIEIVLGAKRDQVGAMVSCGSSPAFVEMFNDMVYRLAPLEPADAEAMLDGLRARRILNGVDRGAIGQALSSLADLMIERPDIVSVDINPALVSESGLTAVAVQITVAAAAGVPA